MKIAGLVDLQVNGYKGVDFSHADLTEESFASACRGMLQSGATAFLATVITSSDTLYAQNLPIMAKVIGRDEFRGRVLGVHLEGPFISAADGARGAHDARWVRTPAVDYLKRLMDMAQGSVRLITIAAEIEGTAELARFAAENGVAVSLGHQMAGAADLVRLADAGATALTHLGNGVPLMVNRHANPILAGLAEDRLAAMMITDGQHLPPGLIKTIIRTKGVGNCIVTSDATALSGMPAGEYENLGKKVVLGRSGRISDPATGYLVGSSATMLDCMNYLASLNLVECEALAVMAFANPLRLIGAEASQLMAGQAVRFDEERLHFSMWG